MAAVRLDVEGHDDGWVGWEVGHGARLAQAVVSGRVAWRSDAVARTSAGADDSDLRGLRWR